MKTWGRHLLMLAVVFSAMGVAEGEEPVTTLETEIQDKPVHSIRVHIGAGIAYMNTEKLDSDFGSSFSVGMAYRLGRNLPLYAGLDFGISRWSKSADGSVFGIPIEATETITAFHIHPSIYYRMDAGSVHPYFGVSGGPTILKESSSIQIPGIDVSASESKTKLEVFAKVGMDIDITDSFALGIEPKVGVLFMGEDGDDRLIFIPHINAAFSF